MSTTELHWHPATTPPDADITVLCWLYTAEWHSGWWDGQRWLDAATGGRLEGVTHWAEGVTHWAGECHSGPGAWVTSSAAPPQPDLGLLPEPFDYCYEWDGPCGTRKFSAAPHNGMKPHRSVPLYTADQMRTYAADCVRAALAHPAPAAPVKESLTTAPAEPAEPLCACKDRPASQCPGQWEPGCDLGNNPAHVRVIDAPAEPAEPVAHVGDSAFEGWFQGYRPGLRVLKQMLRDAYAAGMSDPTAAQPPQPVQPPGLQDIEQYRLQMAGICTAALGYWKEGDGIHPDYDTPALREVAKLYAKYDALYKAAQPPATAQPVQPPAGWALVQAWKLRRAADVLDRDGDEHGVAADLRAMLAAPDAPPATAQPVQAPPGWVPAHERVPAVGTECVVLVRYEMDKPPFATVDKWDVQREDPIGMGYFDDPAYEGWNDNYECDVIAWLPIPPHPPAEWDQRLPDAAPAPAERDHG